MVLLGGSQSRIIGLAINEPLPNINMTTSGILITVDLKSILTVHVVFALAAPPLGLEVITLPLRNPCMPAGQRAQGGLRLEGTHIWMPWALYTE